MPHLTPFILLLLLFLSSFTLALPTTNTAISLRQATRAKVVASLRRSPTRREGSETSPLPFTPRPFRLFIPSTPSYNGLFAAKYLSGEAASTVIKATGTPFNSEPAGSYQLGATGLFQPVSDPTLIGSVPLTGADTVQFVPPSSLSANRVAIRCSVDSSTSQFACTDGVSTRGVGVDKSSGFLRFFRDPPPSAVLATVVAEYI